jgi:hypothetical protein
MGNLGGGHKKGSRGSAYTHPPTPCGKNILAAALVTAMITAFKFPEILHILPWGVEKMLLFFKASSLQFHLFCHRMEANTFSF